MNSGTSSEIFPAWTGRLPATLVGGATSRWLEPKCLTWNSYSTESYLEKAAAAKLENRAPPNWFERIERCEARATTLLCRLGLQPAVLSDTAHSDAQAMLRLADELLLNVPCIRQSVNAFVRSLHLIDSKGPDYDCSFSDPTIPFSIFISIPSSQGKNRLLRVLEAVVHETMHLQLSAWELLHPIVQTSSDEATWYSPWKKTHRKLGGVLPGMYVFHVVGYVYGELLGRGVLSASDKPFAVSRLAEIKDELEQVAGVQGSQGLSESGVELVVQVLTSHL